MTITHILISIAFYFILMYLSVNLLGLLVRGLFSNPELEKLKQESHEFIKHEIVLSERANKWINIIALILILVFFFLLFHFWNVGVVAAGVMIMVGRLPDLVWEIKHGRKTNLKLMKKNLLFYISAFLPWVAYPVLYYFLYLY